MKARGGRRKKRRARAGGRSARRARRGPLTPPAPPPLPPRSRAEEQDRLPPELGLLEVAVPLWIERFRPMAWEERMKVRDDCLAVLATGKTEKDCLEGVALMVCGAQGKKPGQVAEAFNALAKALALGALQPGGVSFGGMRWEAGP